MRLWEKVTTRALRLGDLPVKSQIRARISMELLAVERACAKQKVETNMN